MSAVMWLAVGAPVVLALSVAALWWDSRMQRRGRDEFARIVADDRELQELAKRTRFIVWPDWAAPGDRRA